MAAGAQGKCYFIFGFLQSAENPHEENLSIFGRTFPLWEFAEKLPREELSSILENISQRVFPRTF
jgi:UDP-2,3-diacylglucosamine pyrophosphatase LpxH